MGYVSSYLFVSHYDDEGIKRIESKLSEIKNIKFKFKEPELNERGGKACQFGDMFFGAFNYFDDTTFQEWLKEQKFEEIQVFFMGEDGEEMSEINTKQTINEADL